MKVEASSSSRVAGGILVAVIGAWCAVLAIAYLSGSPTTKRYQVESAAAIFIASAFAWNAIRAMPTGDGIATRVQHSAGAWIAWSAAAVALYWPALHVGFLSDDFVLVDRASRLALGFMNPESFRPVPLLVWTIILRAGGGPVWFHLLNLLLHGTNANLATRLVAPFLRNRITTVVAGAIVLTLPVVCEAVVWCSGVFDVMMTTFVLLAVLAARRYDDGGTAPRLAFAAFTALAVLSKETGIVTPLLVLADAWARRSRARRLYLDSGILLVVLGAIGVLRLAMASASVRRPLTKYVLQRWLFGTVGGLAVPFHADVLRAHPTVAIVAACIPIVLLVAYGLRSSGDAQRRGMVMTGAWILAATAPAMTFFFISPDLQNSRYLALAGPAWGGLLAILIDADRRTVRVAGTALVCVVVTLGVYGVRRHLEPWREAAVLRDAVEEAARTDPRMAACGAVSIAEAPDSVRGAYVFRNGIAEALRRDVGVNASSASGRTECAFAWEASGHRFRIP